MMPMNIKTRQILNSNKYKYNKINKLIMRITFELFANIICSEDKSVLRERFVFVCLFVCFLDKELPSLQNV